MEIPELGKNLTNDKIDMPYPCIRLYDISDALSLVIPQLPTGEISVVIEHEGVVRRVGKVARSALVLMQIRKLSRLTYYKNAAESFDVNTAEDLMEAL